MSNSSTDEADGSSSQDKLIAAVAKYLHIVLSHATTVDDELQRSKKPSYPVNDHVVRSNCKVLLWLLGPVIPLREATDPSALAVDGVKPIALASFFATHGRETDMQGVFRWLACLSRKLRDATSRPDDGLVGAWQDATALLRKVVAETVERDLPRLAGKPAALPDDFADLTELPHEIRSILQRGDFPHLSDDEYAKLGAWLSANPCEVAYGLDAANVAKTRRMEEAKKRLSATLGYNAALRESAAPTIAQSPSGTVRDKPGDEQTGPNADESVAEPPGCEQPPSDPEPGRHHRRLPPKEDEFRAKVLLVLEYNNRSPKAGQMTRREIAGVFGIGLNKSVGGKSKKKRTLKAVETWGQSPRGKECLDLFRDSADGCLWIKKLEAEGIPGAAADSSNISSQSTPT